MKLYLVRHGESTYNAKRLHQHGEAPLSELGMKQASYVAKRLKTIPIDIILSSTYTRARQTADIIADTIGKEIIEVELLRELKRPTEVEHKPYNHPLSVQIREEIRKNRHNPSWHYSDEDNFHDFRDRIKRFLGSLNHKKEQNILAVTHGHTIRAIIAEILLGNIVTPDILERFEHVFKIRNTGITLCEKDKDNKWKLLTWNDYAHLGEIRNE